MKAHKAELLAAIQRDDDNLDSDPWIEQFDVDGCLWLVNPQCLDLFNVEVVDPPEPCSECETLELWQSLTGKWKCLRCDPPTTAQRLRERVARIRSDRTDSLRMNKQADG